MGAGGMGLSGAYRDARERSGEMNGRLNWDIFCSVRCVGAGCKAFLWCLVVGFDRVDEWKIKITACKLGQPCLGRTTATNSGYICCGKAGGMPPLSSCKPRPSSMMPTILVSALRNTPSTLVHAAPALSSAFTSVWYLLRHQRYRRLVPAMLFIWTPNTLRAASPKASSCTSRASRSGCEPTFPDHLMGQTSPRLRRRSPIGRSCITWSWSTSILPKG